MKHTWKKAAAGLMAMALIVGAAPANVGTGGLFGGTGITAYADETETLLTTITATGKEQASYSTENVANVSFSYSAQGSSDYTNNGKTNWGWWGYGWTATVTPAEGYTITKCVFYDDKDRTATDSKDPFVVETTEEDKTPKVNGTPILAYQSKGITKIEVYGYATPAAKTDISTATVTLATDNKVSAVTLGETTIDSTEYDVTYGTTAETATSEFPTEAGKYYAFVTAKTDSENYTGTAKSEQFVVNGTLADGTYKQTAVSDGKYFTRFVFVKPLSVTEGKTKAKFTAHYKDKTFSFESSEYYTSMVSNGITYTPSSEGSVLFVVTVQSGSDISADLTCDLAFE